jgi:hypothetical protein
MVHTEEHYPKIIVFYYPAPPELSSPQAKPVAKPEPKPAARVATRQHPADTSQQEPRDPSLFGSLLTTLSG